MLWQSLLLGAGSIEVEQIAVVFLILEADGSLRPILQLFDIVLLKSLKVRLLRLAFLYIIFYLLLP